MKIGYDPQGDILFFELLNTSIEGSQRLPFGDAIVDLSTDGTIIGIEIMDASQKYPAAHLQAVTESYDEPISLLEAAQLTNTTQDALRKAIERGRLVGKKIGRNWTTTAIALRDYLNSRYRGDGKATA